MRETWQEFGSHNDEQDDAELYPDGGRESHRYAERFQGEVQGPERCHPQCEPGLLQRDEDATSDSAQMDGNVREHHPEQPGEED